MLAIPWASSAHINGLIAAHALESHPNIGLDLLQHVAQGMGPLALGSALVTMRRDMLGLRGW